jgi:uncharacterized protein (TIGR03067 family)
MEAFDAAAIELVLVNVESDSIQHIPVLDERRITMHSLSRFLLTAAALASLAARGAAVEPEAKNRAASNAEKQEDERGGETQSQTINAKYDLKKIQGRWICTLCQESGEIRPDYQVPVLIQGNKLTFETKNGGDVVSFALDPGHSPKRFQWIHEGEVFDRPVPLQFRGIYLLDGDTLVICASNWGTIYSPPQKDAGSGEKDDSRRSGRRPESFESSKSNEQGLLIFKRDHSATHDAKSPIGKEQVPPATLTAIEAELSRLDKLNQADRGPEVPSPSAECAYFLLLGLSSRAETVVKPAPEESAQLRMNSPGPPVVKELLTLTADARLVKVRARIQDKSGSYTIHTLELYRKQGDRWQLCGKGSTATSDK